MELKTVFDGDISLIHDCDGITAAIDRSSSILQESESICRFSCVGFLERAGCGSSESPAPGLTIEVFRKGSLNSFDFARHSVLFASFI